MCLLRDVIFAQPAYGNLCAVARQPNEARSQMSTRLCILIRLHTCRGAGVQKAMYQSMTASLQIPHLVYCDEVEMDGLKALRTQVKQMRKDIAISFMPFLFPDGLYAEHT